MAEAYRNNLDHLRDEFAWLDLNLRLGVLRMKASHWSWGGACVSEQSVEAVLRPGERAPEHSTEEAELTRQIAAKRQEITARVRASRERGVALQLVQVQDLFSLSPFERDAIVVCLAPELDTKYERLYGYLQDDVTRRQPSVDLVLRLLCRAAEERATARRAFLPSSRLFQYRLVRSLEDGGGARSLLSRSLKLDDGIVHHLLGGREPDPRIAFCSRLVQLAKPPGTAGTVVGLGAFFHDYVGKPPSDQWIALFHGQDRLRQEETARCLCADAGVPLLRVDLAALAEGEIPFEQTVPLVFRDAALKAAAVYADNVDALVREGEKDVSRLRSLERALEELGWVTFLAGRHPVELSDSLKRQILFAEEFPCPEYPERKRLWHEVAGNGRLCLEDSLLDDLAGRFRFTRREIQNAVALAGTRAAVRDGGASRVTRSDLEAACRSESNVRLLTFARKLVSTYRWDDLVLPEGQKTRLREIIDYIRNHDAVYSEWGFGARHSLGKGINILFSGPSGTGKTMAAGIIAMELGLDIYKIDLSTVVSKYIGETEKNLSRIFREAETSNAVLFFDEADALFGKRSEVKDSHDRYANIEVNYLLQKMEEHEGVVILATNLSKNVDDAFLRRVHFSVVFPLPEKEERLRVWQRVFPAAAPVGGDIDWEFLARRFKIVGGNIKNIAMGAAFLARRENSHISMRHIVLSAKREFEKMGKLCTKAEFGDYHDLVA
jgi:SpoVK/Ycf46/Vps4 family AAA+-type ATPase